MLRIDEAGVGYETVHRKHARTWVFRDLRRVEFVSPTHLIIDGYLGHEMSFRLLEGEFSAEAYRLLADNVARTVTSRVPFPASKFLYELPVKHRHRLGGCEGVLRIGGTRLVYQTDNAEDRRIWRARDIRSFGTTGPYHLRLTTDRETFSFDLKTPLEREVYDYLWTNLYAKENK